MRNEDKKTLANFLGKHFLKWEWRSDKWTEIPRNFDTWEDFGVLWKKVKENEGWELFISRLYYAESSHHAIESNDYPGYIDVDQVDKDLFPFLVLKAIKEGVLK